MRMKGKRRNSYLKKVSLKEQLTEALDIPKEVITNLPVITLTGNQEIVIENFNSLIEYTAQKIRLHTKSGILVIDGIELEAKNMTAEKICIKGHIIQIAFVV
ncbi:MAG: hypothetical protein K0S30_583 [Clostridia bacterium]|jgi:sporulation protein YqfC|nr:hypothetical protein [Clostridia bacterium]